MTGKSLTNRSESLSVGMHAVSICRVGEDVQPDVKQVDQVEGVHSRQPGKQSESSWAFGRTYQCSGIMVVRYIDGL